MPNPLKIVAIGAGSGFGRGILADVLGSVEFSDLGCTLSLVDTNEGALDVTYRFAQRVKAHHRSNVQIEATTDRREALPRASYVITSVAIKRYPLWEQDFRIPLSYGFRHVLGENGGPGAAFHAMRNFELMIPICRDMEQLCPDALLLNFTNPEARIVRAVCELTNVRAVGLCHGTAGALAGASQILGRPLEELDILSGGLNHFLWITKVTDRRTGADLYPELRRRGLSDPDCPAMPPLVKKMMEVFGLYTFPSDDHIGEYLSFGSEFSGTKWKYGSECRRVPLTEPAPGTRSHWLERVCVGPDSSRRRCSQCERGAGGDDYPSHRDESALLGRLRERAKHRWVCRGTPAGCRGGSSRVGGWRGYPRSACWPAAGGRGRILPDPGLHPGTGGRGLPTPLPQSASPSVAR